MARKICALFLLLAQLVLLSSVALAWDEDIEQEKRGGWGGGGGAGMMSMPVPDGTWTMTSPFGWRIHPIYGDKRYHSGIDFGVNYGTEIRAAASGVVTLAGWVSGYGNTVIIDHGNGITTLYGHNQDILVVDGTQVNKGDVIAYAGSTGNSTGPHCHFEVRLNDNPVDPGFFLGPEIEQEEIRQGMIPGSSPNIDFNANNEFEVVTDFAKPMKEVIDTLVDGITAAFDALKSNLLNVFMVLAIIDLAVAAMYKSLGAEDDNTNFVNWFLYKIIFYAMMVFVLSNFGKFVGNLALYGFPSFSVIALQSDADTVGNAVSDPTQIIQKGMEIVVPIVNEALKLHSIWEIPTKGLLNFICLIFGLGLIFCFLLIGFQILIAYLYFYFTVLFAFTSFMLSGLKHTRKYASNGINGIFAASINLMFFCLFAMIVQTTMANVTVGTLVETKTVQTTAGAPTTPSAPGTISSGTSSSGADISGRPKAEVALHVQQILRDEYGYNFRADLIWAQMAHESGSDFSSYLARNCHNYSGMKETGDGGRTDDGYAIYLSDDSYARYYARTLAAYARDNGLDQSSTPQEYAEALHEGGYMSAGVEEYAQGMQRALNGSSGTVMTTILHIALLFKLLLLCMMMIYFADRLMKTINKTFGGMGFRLTNEQ